MCATLTGQTPSRLIVVFIFELLQPIVNDAIKDTLLKETFDESRSQLLIDLICDRVMNGLSGLGLPMKFVGNDCRLHLFMFLCFQRYFLTLGCKPLRASVSCVIMQNTGAGMNRY